MAGTTSERSVDPVGLVSSGYRWYLVAWDNAREAWRTFRVDRIGGQVSVGQRFVPRPLPEQGDLQKYVSRSVSVAVYSHKARIIVHAPRQVVCEHISPAAGMLEALDDERCVLVTGGQSLESLALHLTLLGLDFEVQEPPELIDYLRTLHQRLGRVLVASGRRASRSGDRARTRRKPR